jgi:hypothetical protein
LEGWVGSQYDRGTRVLLIAASNIFFFFCQPVSKLLTSNLSTYGMTSQLCTFLLWMQNAIFVGSRMGYVPCYCLPERVRESGCGAPPPPVYSKTLQPLKVTLHSPEPFAGQQNWRQSRWRIYLGT